MYNLFQLYANRAREYSDAVARLGQHREIGPDFFELVKEIKRRHELCALANLELDKYIEQNAGSLGASANE